MAVRIRLMRMGSKRRPFYRFVVADSRGKRDGGFLEQVGTYNPIEKPLKIEVNEDKVFEWLAKGAQLSDGARSLLKKAGTLARWDAKRTGREAPAKALPLEEAPKAAKAEEAKEEAVDEAPAEKAPPKESPAETGPSEEAAPEVAQAEAGAAEETGKESADDVASADEKPKEA